MKKVFVSILILAQLAPLNYAYAGIVGSRCSNSGASLSQNGSKFICKNVGGKLKWQKAPGLTDAQKAKLWTDCLVSESGNAGFTNDQLINASQACRKKLGFGY